MRKWIKRPGFMIALVVVMASVAMVAAACGGDDDEVDTPVPPPAAAAPPPGAAAPPPPPPPPGAVAQPTKAPAAPAPTKAPAAMVGTIPGTKLTVAVQSIGKTTQEAVEAPYDASRPGSNMTKDEILRISSDAVLIPHVVSEWDFGFETRSWTLTMRDDIKFPSFGRNANSDDLKWSIFEGHWTGFKSGGSISRHFQTSVPTIVDGLTLKIDFEAPTFGVAYAALTVREETTHLTPGKELLAMGNGDANAGWAAYMATEPGPQASGGYTYVRQVAQEFNEYTVNTDWWHDPHPDFERLIFQEVTEPGTRIALIATEQADLINLSAPTLSQAAVIDHVKVLANPHSVFVQFFYLNLWEEGHPAYDPDVVFLDKRVREAFLISVNRQEINDVIYNGASASTDAPIMNPVNSAWTHPIVLEMRNNPIPFDPAKAKQLLADANFDFSVTIPAAQRGASSAVPEWPELNEAVVNGWIKSLGVDILLEQTQENVYGQLHDGKSVRWWLWGGERIGGGSRDNLGPARYFGPGSVNFAATHWDAISDMRENALATADFEEYNKWLGTISKFMRDEAILVPILTNPIYYGAHKDRVESWPLVPGITREHGIPFIRATEALRKSR